MIVSVHARICVCVHVRIRICVRVSVCICVCVCMCVCVCSVLPLRVVHCGCRALIPASAQTRVSSNLDAIPRQPQSAGNLLLWTTKKIQIWCKFQCSGKASVCLSGLTRIWKSALHFPPKSPVSCKRACGHTLTYIQKVWRWSFRPAYSPRVCVYIPPRRCIFPATTTHSNIRTCAGVSLELPFCIKTVRVQRDHMLLQVYIYTYQYIYICIYTCIYLDRERERERERERLIYTYIHTYICIYYYICICIYIYIYTCIYAYVHTYLYIHIYTRV